MKCAKCGTEVPDDQPCCPNCATAGSASARQYGNEPPVRCPACGSTQISAVRRNYDSGCGWKKQPIGKAFFFSLVVCFRNIGAIVCLGLLLFGWVGLLLGLLGADDVEMVCNQCGARWPAGRPRDVQTGIGCGPLLLVLLLLWLLLSLL